ncbi:hypothetical protein V1477_010846 [Vespula maculifrons]|uniref:Uncharacterized protein n=1 Tax=Vespula maculifrons TaxID=7453 RepID=A0ABD2C337_VESMC
MDLHNVSKYSYSLIISGHRQQRHWIKFILHVGNTDVGAGASIQLNLAGRIRVVSRQISL